MFFFDILALRAGVILYCLPLLVLACSTPTLGGDASAGTSLPRELVLVKNGLGGPQEDMTAQHGPDAVWAMLKEEVGKEAFLDPRFIVPPPPPLDLNGKQGVDRYVAQMEQVFDLQQDVKKQVHGAITDDKTRDVVIVLSGSHTTAVGAAAGVWQKFHGKRMGVIWVDAHTDINTPWTTDSGNPHGMPVAAMAGLSKTPGFRVPEGEEETWQQVDTHWERYDSELLAGNRLGLDDLLFVGVRSIDEPGELSVIQQHDVDWFTVSQVRGCARDTREEELVEFLQTKFRDVDVIVINIDVDVLDEQFVPGTGTPVSGGLTPDELSWLVTTILRTDVVRSKVAMVEITEADPKLDDDELKTIQQAANVAKLVHKTLDAADPPR